MPNNLYQQLNSFTQQNDKLQQLMNSFGGLQGMINEYNNFRNTFQGNPQQIVQNLIQNGKMSQSEYDQLSQIASQFKNLLNRS